MTDDEQDDLPTLQKTLLFQEQETVTEQQVVAPRAFRRQNNCIIELDSAETAEDELNPEYLLNAYPNDFDFAPAKPTELTLYVLYQQFDVGFVGL